MCPNCQTNKGTTHALYGVLPCNECTTRQNTYNLPSVQVEMTGEIIKQERKDFARSIIQPFRAGELSKEYIDMYGTKSISVTEEEVANAKEVWTDLQEDEFDLSKTK
jgi:hypothetical protein